MSATRLPVSLTRVLLGLSLLVGCGEPLDAVDDLTEEPVPELEHEPLLEELARTRTPPLGRADPGFVEMQAKRDKLDSAVRAEYFGSSIDSIRKTPDGVLHQFFRGTRGIGAIYVVNGTRAVYGPILDRWAEYGYERGWLGYPTTDTQGLGTSREQQFYVEHMQPDTSNQGLLRVRRMLRGTSVANYHEAREYLVSGYPDSWSPFPQKCEYEPYSYLQGSIEATISPGQHLKLWCGNTPIGSYTGSDDVSVDDV